MYRTVRYVRESSEEGGSVNVFSDFLAGLVSAGLALGGLVLVASLLLALLWALGGHADPAKWDSRPPPYLRRPTVRPQTTRGERAQENFGTILGFIIVIGMLSLIVMPLVPGPDPSHSSSVPLGRPVVSPEIWKRVRGVGG